MREEEYIENLLRKYTAEFKYWDQDTILKKKADSRAGIDKVQDNPEHLVPGSKM